MGTGSVSVAGGGSVVVGGGGGCVVVCLFVVVDKRVVTIHHDDDVDDSTTGRGVVLESPTYSGSRQHPRWSSDVHASKSGPQQSPPSQLQPHLRSFVHSFGVRWCTIIIIITIIITKARHTYVRATQRNATQRNAIQSFALVASFVQHKG